MHSRPGWTSAARSPSRPRGSRARARKPAGAEVLGMSRVSGSWRLSGALAAAALATLACADGYAWRLPRGFPEPAVPADNPMSEAKVALGMRLFSDPRLSASGRHSCRSCHSPELAFTDGLPRSRGVGGEILPLNAPTLFNVAYNPSLGWNDPAVRTLEQQM